MASSTKATGSDFRHEVIKRGENDLVMAYLSEIAKYAVLTDAEEMELGRDKEAGELAEWHRRDGSARSGAETKRLADIASKGRRARKRLTEGNLGLVVSIARRYQGQGLALLSLIEEGNRGLLRAVDKFDGTPEQRARWAAWGAAQDHALVELRFSTFATSWIITAIHRALGVAQHPRIPYSGEIQNNAEVRKLQKILEELPVTLGREPTVDEVAGELGFTPERARRYVSSMFAKLDMEPNEDDNERVREYLRTAGNIETS